MRFSPKTVSEFLLVLVLSSALAPSVPLVFSEEVASVDITDYLNFEVGTWWEYDTHSEDLIHHTSAEDKSLTIQRECDDDEHTECYSTQDEGGVSTVYVEDNVSYYSVIEDEESDQGIISIDSEGYEQAVDERSYSLMGLEGLEDVSISCTYEIEEDYEFQDENYVALIEECSLTATLEGMDFESAAESVHLKGLGPVDIDVISYLNTIPFLQNTMTLVNSSLLSEGTFSDVDTSIRNYEAVQYLYEEGVFSGYSDGTFLPDNTVNRAELIKILVEGQDITPDETVYANCFNDVSSEWYAKYVCYAKEEGWVSGYLDGTFLPGQAVNKVEALKMLFLSQNIDLAEGGTDFADVTEEDWFATYVKTAQELGVLEENGIYFNPASEKDRKGIAENLYRLLLSQEVGQVTDSYAEVTCSIFENVLDGEDYTESVEDILEENGYDHLFDLEFFIFRIEEFSFYDTVHDLFSSALEQKCGTVFEESEVDPDLIVEDILF